MREIVEMIEANMRDDGGPAFRVVGHYYLQGGKITYDGVDAEQTRAMKWLMNNTKAYINGKLVSAADRPVAWFGALPMTFSGLAIHAKLVT